MATTTTTTTHLTAGLEDANLASKILSHQVAADAVHSRELAALQLKYATKTTELDAAHATRRTGPSKRRSSSPMTTWIRVT